HFSCFFISSPPHNHTTQHTPTHPHPNQPHLPHCFDLHFGFDELTGKVQLYAQILAAQLTLECFEATLANLLDHAEFWQRLLPCDGDREAVAAVGMRV
ncbi:CesT family type III secretion system chaperone, partial [Pseudomonas aeruginosa]|uniref:CesT family type III secretion system chaperone n=1 Tax=Pseudomonas aeruginosa TaxID=287 RepID=UPI0039819517